MLDECEEGWGETAALMGGDELGALMAGCMEYRLLLAALSCLMSAGVGDPSDASGCWPCMVMGGGGGGGGGGPAPHTAGSLRPPGGVDHRLAAAAALR